MPWNGLSRRVKNKEEVSVEAIYAKFQTINYLANRKEVSELVNSRPGSPDPTKWTTSVFSRALQKPPETISKYARTDPYKKQSLNRKSAWQRKK
jgi:hypothetical protein